MHVPTSSATLSTLDRFVRRPNPASMAGDPSFDVARFLMNEMSDAATALRADAMADRLGLDRDRTRAWLFALATQAASWFLSTGDKPTHDAYHHVTSTLLRA